jgi:2-oxo-4-hydroxy-4-carboxy-5-ureidoimidazoline decarboxylase
LLTEASRLNTDLPLNTLPAAEAERALLSCCGSTRWANLMVARRPFASRQALYDAADDFWRRLDLKDYLQAFAQHPAIGADLGELRKRFASSADWSSEQQSDAEEADQPTLAALRAGNLAYAARFGFIYIVCPTGKSAREVLSNLEERLRNAPAIEIGVTAAEQAKIMRLRLEKLS